MKGLRVHVMVRIGLVLFWLALAVLLWSCWRMMQTMRPAPPGGPGLERKAVGR